ncbi:MAG: transposase [Solirubrobacteraceae bacterium]
MIGLDLREVGSEAFWIELLRELRHRGLQGVRLCVSDQHEGLRNAIARVLSSPWQRCTLLGAPWHARPEHVQARWQKKLAWYEKNGYADRLIISKDGTGGSLDEQEIERITRERILAT